jgi:hypothetical protein
VFQVSSVHHPTRTLSRLGAEEDLIDAICEDISEVTCAVLPYSVAAKPKEIRNGDLLQVIWYAHKMPRKHYQVWTRSKGKSLEQYQGASMG